jgi:hypothetical protein
MLVDPVRVREQSTQAVVEFELAVELLLPGAGAQFEVGEVLARVPVLVRRACPIETPANAGQARTLTESPASQNQCAQAVASFVTNSEQESKLPNGTNGRLRRHAIL